MRLITVSNRVHPWLILLAASCAFAQRPTYEAAIIKPHAEISGNSSSHGTKGQIMMDNQSLRRLIERAFGVQSFQVSGPDFLDNLRFDIAAKYPPDTNNADRIVMLRSLLEDRFKLAVHRETKDLPGYALVVAKNGFKLKPVDATGGDETSTNGTGLVTTLTAKRTTMETLASLLCRYTGTMVVDKTGITGAYDFEFKWVNEDQPTNTSADTLPSLFNAVQETLGLRLQPQKVPTQMIVIDHIERSPIE